MQKEQKLSHYISKAESLDSLNYEKKIRIAVLGSFTLNGIDETIRVKCSELNIGCTTYIGGYNQYNQEILDSHSNLYKFNADLTILIFDSRTILESIFHFPYSINATTRKQFIEKRTEEISVLVESYVKKSNSKLLITNLSAPFYSPYGIYETKTDYNLLEMISEFNSKLVSIAKKTDSLFVYDFDGFIRRFGAQNVFDFKQYFFGDVRISFDYIPYLVNDWLGYIKAILGLNKKCIVLDLDNTIWGGVVGEDGFDGIKLGDNPIGRAFVEFQKLLLGLHQRGIILAINSKNNEDDVLRIIREHPSMILKEEHFSSVRINWSDKVQNMKEIADDLNIGLESIVFFDDDPLNREYMRINLPQVLTVELPEDVSQYALTLMNMNDFQILKVTDEDLNRGKMYSQDRQRKKLEKSTTNLQDFLRSLDIKLIIKQANNFTIPRISQLTLKTNQFNLTTKRYQEEDIRQFVQNEHDYLVGCAQVMDKFGDNGITGVFIVKKQDFEWLIDTFLLSCRIMGRNVEDGMLSYILKKAKEEGIDRVKGEFIPTKKNVPCMNFLSDYGFKKDGKYWVFTTKNNPIKIPTHLTLNIENDT